MQRFREAFTRGAAVERTRARMQPREAFVRDTWAVAALCRVVLSNVTHLLAALAIH